VDFYPFSLALPGTCTAVLPLRKDSGSFNRRVRLVYVKNGDHEREG
jgi:hypothetical protein